MGKQLGAGAFGKVVKGEALGIVAWEPNTVVAVKMIKPSAEISYLKALMSELKIMVHLGRYVTALSRLQTSTNPGISILSISWEPALPI